MPLFGAHSYPIGKEGKKIKKASMCVYLLYVPGELYIAAENTYTKKQVSFGLRIVQSYVRIWYNDEYTSFLQVI